MTTDPKELAEIYIPQLKDNLTNVIIDFWIPRSIDEIHGGFITDFDQSGEFAGNDDKMIVTQARLVWFFAHLYRRGYGDHFLDIARHGFEFLTHEMKDANAGGYYWQVTRNGTVRKPNKHLYGQAFVLYALSEYYLASEDKSAREFAIQLFDVIEQEAYDDEFGGYIEYFEPDWTPITDGSIYLDSIEPEWSPKQHVDAEIPATTKLMNTHLHLMEAFTTFYRATDHQLSRQRLVELLTINTNTVVRKTVGACTDKYDPDWEPMLTDDEYQITSYGHDIENVWLSMEAADALNSPVTYYRDLYETLWEYTLTNGYDEDKGGIYFYGPIGEVASNHYKTWWVQAEGLISSLRMYELTDDQLYLNIFRELFDFIDRHLVDRMTGEWHSAIAESNEPVGPKGALYKGPYHNGRALLESINTLETIT